MRPEIEELFRNGAMPPCAQTLGADILDVADGYIKVRFMAREEFYNPAGVVQGGFLSAMLDDTLGPAILTTLDEGEVHTTIDLHVRFLRPAVAGPLISEGRVTHRGRTVRVSEGTLSTEDGKLVAVADCSCAILRRDGG
jgi:uncharacterized protein (TIGR00369 family)